MENWEEEEPKAIKRMDVMEALPNMNILNPLPDNPVLQILTKTGAQTANRRDCQNRR